MECSLQPHLSLPFAYWNMNGWYWMMQEHRTDRAKFSHLLRKTSLQFWSHGAIASLSISANGVPVCKFNSTSPWERGWHVKWLKHSVYTRLWLYCCLTAFIWPNVPSKIIYYLTKMVFWVLKCTVSLTFQSQREDGYIPASCGWHLHQPALYGRPSEWHKLMRSPGDIRNRFVRQEQTKKDQRYGLTFNPEELSYPTLMHFFKSRRRLISTLDLLQTESGYRFGFGSLFCTWLLTAWTKQGSYSNNILWLLHVIWFTGT